MKDKWIYRHNLFHINYTTYDVCRAQETVNPRTYHCNVMLLSHQPSAHPFCYAHVLGIYHTNTIYIGPGLRDYQSCWIEFLWVWWFEVLNHSAGWDHNTLDSVKFPPMAEADAFDFIDPADVVTHQTCLVLWTWRKLADETNAKNAPKICWKIVPTWGIQTALAIHITQSQDYPYAKNEYKLVIAIYGTRMTILMQEMNAITDSHLSHENCQEAEESKGLMTISVWKRSAAFCSPTPIPEQSKKQKKWMRNKGEKEESFLAPKCQI